jgi:4-amino-4-deoxy-L-arabinose transferase-like glycosyltransferase
VSAVSVRDRWLLVAVLLFAGLMRAAYLVELEQAPDFDRPQFESQYHDYWARALNTGDWTPPDGVTDPDIPHRVFFRPPGYPYFLALIYRIGSDGYVWPRLIQMLLGLASCLLVFELARRCFGPGSALVAAFLQGSYWIFIYFEGEFMAPPLLNFLVLLTLVLVSRWTVEMTVGGAVAAGVGAGVSALVRPNMLALIPIFLLWGAWVEWRRGNAGERFLFVRRGIAFAAAAALVVVPATLRNHRVADDWVLITSNAGINLFVGLHPDSNGYTPGVRDLAELTGLDGWDSFDYPLIAASVEQRVGREMADSEVSRWFARRAVSRAIEHPGQVISSLGRKLLLFWGPAEVSNTKIIEYERMASPTLRHSLSFASVLALGLLGAGLSASSFWNQPADKVTAQERPDPNLVLLLLLFVTAYAATYLPFFVASRFRVPIIPVVIIFGAFALRVVLRMVVGRQWRALAVVLVAFAALRVLTGVEWVAYEPDGALWHWRRGLLYEERGLPDSALEEFKAAVALRPDNAKAQFSLAEAYASAGDLERAIRHYNRHIQLSPHSVDGSNNLALALAESGDLQSAMIQWEETLEMAPSDPTALNNLATALLIHPDVTQRDVSRAIALAEKGVVATAHRDVELLRTLAAAYLADGREADAKAVADEIENLSKVEE